MSFLNELPGLGFARLPSLDQSYFRTHTKEGFFILANESTKQYYAIKTINAYSCLDDINSLLEGKERGRALLLERALHESRDAEDWEAFFRPGSINAVSRRKALASFKGWQSLAGAHQRVDDDMPMFGWKIVHRPTGYVAYVFNEKELSEENILGDFLRHWRNTAIQGNRDKRLDLNTFYKVSAQIAGALNSWTKSDYNDFKIEVCQNILGKPRREARLFARNENVILANHYLKSLQNVQRKQKESIDLESTP